MTASRNDAMAATPHPDPFPADAGRGGNSSRGAQANRWVRVMAEAIDFPFPSLAMREGQGKYENALIYHWLHDSQVDDTDHTASPILESLKRPGENRVWFRYPEQGFRNTAANSQNYTGTSAEPSIL